MVQTWCSSLTDTAPPVSSQAIPSLPFASPTGTSCGRISCRSRRAGPTLQVTIGGDGRLYAVSGDIFGGIGDQAFTVDPSTGALLTTSESFSEFGGTTQSCACFNSTTWRCCTDPCGVVHLQDSHAARCSEGLPAWSTERSAPMTLSYKQAGATAVIAAPPLRSWISGAVCGAMTSPCRSGTARLCADARTIGPVRPDG